MKIRQVLSTLIYLVVFDALFKTLLLVAGTYVSHNAITPTSSDK
jgi:hypothetical protein